MTIPVKAFAAAVAAMLAAALVLGLTKDDDHEATLVGYFKDASPLDPGSQIRLSGVNVGSVRDIELKDGLARVTFDVDDAILPLHEDATMTIRPVNLLGESYVDLDAGTPKSPTLDEPVVADNRTTTRVTLEDVLNTFDEPTSAALATVLTTLGEGTHDSGAEASAAIHALEPAMRDADQLAGILADQNDVLSRLLVQLDPVTAGLADRHGQSLDLTVQAAERLLSVVADNRAALESSIDGLPETLTSARRALSRLEGAADATTPVLTSLRPVTGRLSEIVDEIDQFASAADPAFRSLAPVLARANELLREAAPVIKGLRQAGPDLKGTASGLRPIGNVALDEHLDDLMAFVRKWALSTNGRDGLSNYFRGALWITPETLQYLVPSLPTATGDTGTDLPDNLEGLLDLPGSVDLPGVLDSVDGLLSGGLLGGRHRQQGDQRADPSATGLTPQQENALLTQLLGGR